MRRDGRTVIVARIDITVCAMARLLLRRCFYPSLGAVPLLACAMAHACYAETFRATPSDYLMILKKLQPGDHLLLASGEYRDGLPLHRLNGKAGKPIVITGPTAGDPAILLGRSGANTVSIVDSSYLTLRNMLLDGQGLDVDGVKAEGHARWAHHITLENLRIVNHHHDQQIVGISTKCPAWGWVIRGNVIIGAGTGMYLGHSNGSAPFVGGLIENNLIVDTIGYNLQIKHQTERAHVEGMPGGKSVTVIRHNVFSKLANGSRGRMARPNLLVGHWPPTGSGAEDVYAIYGNFFYQNPNEALFQGEGNIAFYSNVLVNTHGDAINVQAHNGVPRRVDVFRNTILAASSGIRISGGDPAHRQQVMANVVFAKASIAGGEQHANQTGTLQEAADHLADPFEPISRLDLAPTPGKLISEAINSELPSFLPDVNRDFEGRSYDNPVAGAYARASTQRLQLERRRPP